VELGLVTIFESALEGGKEYSRATRSELEFGKLVEEAFLKYRTKGFPNYFLTPEDKFRTVTQLSHLSHSHLIVDGDMLQTMHGLALAWSYFLHAWSGPVRFNENTNASVPVGH